MRSITLQVDLEQVLDDRAIFICSSWPGQRSAPSIRIESRIEQDFLGEGYRASDHPLHGTPFRVQVTPPSCGWAQRAGLPLAGGRLGGNPDEAADVLPLRAAVGRPDLPPRR
jgi:hypothetical protein